MLTLNEFVNKSRKNPDDAIDQLKAAGAKHVVSQKAGIAYQHDNGSNKLLPHYHHPEGYRYVKTTELEDHLSKLK